MRISEGLQLRVKDLDFDHGTIIAGGQGLQGSGLMLPESLAPACASSCRVHGHGG